MAAEGSVVIGCDVLDRLPYEFVFRANVTGDDGRKETRSTIMTPEESVVVGRVVKRMTKREGT